MCMLNALAHQSSMQELDLLNPQLDPRITFSRASTKTYFDSDGLMHTAANDAWPLEYDPVTLKPIGRSVWEQRTNLLPKSTEFSDAAYWNKIGGMTVTAAAGLALDGTMTACRIANDGSNAFAQIYSNNMSLAAGTRYTITAWVKPESVTGKVALRAYRDGSNYSTLEISNLATTPVGVISELGVTGSTYTIDAGPGGRYKLTLSFTPGIANGWGVRWYNCFGVANINSVILDAFQCEAGAFASPYIPTAGSQVTRVADDPRITDLGAVRYNSSQLTALLLLRADTVPVITSMPLCVDANGRLVYFNNGSGAGRTPIIWDGTTTRASPNTLTAGVVGKVASSFGPSGLMITSGGSAPLPPVAYDGTFGSSGQLRIGGNATQNVCNNLIQSIRLYPEQLSAAEHQALTA